MDTKSVNAETQKAQPNLIRLPSLQGKENCYIPKLLRLPFVNINTTTPRQTKLINVPLKSQVFNTIPTNRLSVPKLIDLRTVINLTNQLSTQSEEKLRLQKQPKLIKLPNIKCEPALIESPKRSLTPSPRKSEQQLKEPILVDIRPHTPQKTLLLTNNDKTVKDEPRLIKTPDVPRASETPVILKNFKPKKVLVCSSEESEHRSHQHKYKQRRHHEDELYDVIAELILEKKKRRKKRKRLRLFDIIDHIPVTSDSDSEATPPKKNFNKISHKVPDLGLTFLPPQGGANYDTENHNIKKNSLFEHACGLPDPPLNMYKPKVSRYLDPANKKDDPLSWENIIKVTRNETRETQTEKTSKVPIVKTQEIQTEIYDMIDVPRSETFFLDKESDVIRSRKTKEFCDRVRNEVLKKLDFQQMTEEKSMQTVCHAAVQTNELKERNHKEVKSDEEERTLLPPVAPDIFAQLKFVEHSEVGTGDKHFIDIVDVEEDQILSHRNVDDHGKSSNLHHDMEQNKQDIMYNIETIDIHENHVHPIQNKKFFTQNVTTFNFGDGKLKTVSPRHSCSSNEFAASKLKQEKRKITDDQSKSILKDNMNEFSFGLKALEDLHENLEAELKQSKFLFNTIMTLQEGFVSDEQQHDGEHVNREKLGEYSTDKYSVHRYSDTYKTEEVLNIDLHGQQADAPDLSKETEASVVNEKPQHLQDDRDQPHDVFGEPDFQSSIDFEASHDDFEKKKTDDSYFMKQPSKDKSTFSTRSILSPRNIQGDRLSPRSFNIQGDMLSPRSFNSAMKNTSSVRFSDEFMESVLDEENEESKKTSDAKDQAMKNEIRKRILQTSTKQQNETKKEEKRSKLLAWMGDKQKERSEMYKQTQKQKQAAEYRPFVSKRQMSKRDIDHNLTIQEDLKKAMLEENNEERLRAAEKLATEAMSQKNKIQSTPQFRRRFKNERYTKTKLNIPVRETRASRIRKTALISDVVNTTRLRQETSRRKLKRKPDGRRNGLDKSVETNGNESVLFDQSIDRRSTAGRSSRLSVEANEFVTKYTYDKYQVKSAKRLRNAMGKHNSIDYENQYDVIKSRNSIDVRASQNIHPTRFTYKLSEDSKVVPRYNVGADKFTQSSVSLQSSVDNTEVKNILRTYGLQIDDEMFGGKSETSKLLADVDLALLDENTSPTTLDTIDWNEVDKILNE